MVSTCGHALEQLIKIILLPFLLQWQLYHASPIFAKYEQNHLNCMQELHPPLPFPMAGGTSIDFIK